MFLVGIFSSSRSFQVGNSNYLSNFLYILFFAQNVFSKIADYAVASTASAAFIIGGYDAVDVFSTLSTVAEFSQLPSELAGSWKRRGDLQRARADHKAITYLGQTFVIGSWPYPRFVSE